MTAGDSGPCLTPPSSPEVSMKATQRDEVDHVGDTNIIKTVIVQHTQPSLTMVIRSYITLAVPLGGPCCDHTVLHMKMWTLGHPLGRAA